MSIPYPDFEYASCRDMGTDMFFTEDDGVYAIVRLCSHPFQAILINYLGHTNWCPNAFGITLLTSLLIGNKN